MAYRVTGDAWYLQTLKSSYEYLQANECMATGGYGPDESLIPNSRLGSLVKRTSNTFETQCGCWAGFKLAKHLISLTGDAKYGDWVEQLAYNGVAATIPMDSAGRVLYYSNYNPYGARKVNAGEGWTCCAGTRPMAIADVCDQIYYTNQTSLAVNLFIPSVATVSVGGRPVRIEQTTRFPEQSTTTIRIDPVVPTRMKLLIRNPGWLQGSMSALLRGKSVALSFKNGWAEVDRTWRAGDVLHIILPTSMRTISLTKAKEFPKAVVIGPVVLAARADHGGPSLRAITDLRPIPGEPLNYRLLTQPATIFRPFYEFKEGERYYLYLDPDSAGRMHYSEMKTSGDWHDSGLHYFSNSAGAFIEGAFAGDSVELLGYKYDDAGLAEVRVDGKLVETIDQFAPGRDIPASWALKGFGLGNHSIKVSVVHRKVEASKDYFVNVAGIRCAATGGQ